MQQTEREQKVLITTGVGSRKKFHRKSCDYVGNSTREIPISHARNFFDECSFCFGDKP